MCRSLHHRRQTSAQKSAEVDVSSTAVGGVWQPSLPGLLVAYDALATVHIFSPPQLSLYRRQIWCPDPETAALKQPCSGAALTPCGLSVGHAPSQSGSGAFCHEIKPHLSRLFAPVPLRVPEPRRFHRRFGPKACVPRLFNHFSKSLYSIVGYGSKRYLVCPGIVSGGSGCSCPGWNAEGPNLGIFTPFISHFVAQRPYLP